MRGFGTEMAEDDYLYLMDVDETKKLKENIDALEERIEKVDLQREHKRVKDIKNSPPPN